MFYDRLRSGIQLSIFMNNEKVLLLRCVSYDIRRKEVFQHLFCFKAFAIQVAKRLVNFLKTL